jgi:hypothetical protein
MRHTTLAAFIGLVVTAAPAAARDYPYCLQGRHHGYPGVCQFSTYQQCVATASGTDSFFGMNPRFADGAQPRPRGPYQGW